MRVSNVPARGRRSSPGFSLLEVVLALAVFGIAVTAIIGLLPGLTRRTADSAELRVAQGLPDAVGLELTRSTAGGFDGVAAKIPVMQTPLEHGFPLVASRAGERLQSLSGEGVPVTEEQQFFLIEVWRFGTPPLAYRVGDAVLPLYVRVSWPYRLPGSTTPTAAADRTEFGFTLAVQR